MIIWIIYEIFFCEGFNGERFNIIISTDTINTLNKYDPFFTIYITKQVLTHSILFVCAYMIALIPVYIYTRHLIILIIISNPCKTKPIMYSN